MGIFRLLARLLLNPKINDVHFAKKKNISSTWFTFSLFEEQIKNSILVVRFDLPHTCDIHQFSFEIEISESACVTLLYSNLPALCVVVYSLYKSRLVE